MVVTWRKSDPLASGRLAPVVTQVSLLVSCYRKEPWSLLVVEWNTFDSTDYALVFQQGQLFLSLTLLEDWTRTKSWKPKSGQFFLLPVDVDACGHDPAWHFKMCFCWWWGEGSSSLGDVWTPAVTRLVAGRCSESLVSQVKCQILLCTLNKVSYLGIIIKRDV